MNGVVCSIYEQIVDISGEYTTCSHHLSSDEKSTIYANWYGEKKYQNVHTKIERATNFTNY